MSKIKCKDHLGQEFSSEVKMAKHWGISIDAYKYRKSKGLTVEECLTVKLREYKRHKQDVTTKKCKDHLGNEYDSVKSMCEHYGISTYVYYFRASKNWTLERCLTQAVGVPFKHNNKPIKDYRGVEYNSLSDCAKDHNVNLDAVKRNIENGIYKGRVLGRNYEVTDHLGNKFEGLIEMCRFHGIKLSTYSRRIGKGITDIEQLLAPSRGGVKNSESYTDHLGNEFNSLAELCKFHGTSAHAFKIRANSGITNIEELLRSDDAMKIYNDWSSRFTENYTDYLGNKHESIAAYARAYDISPGVLMARIRSGWTERESIVTPKKRLGTKSEINDTSLNPLISIHEYSHTVDLTGDRIFRVTVLSSGETKYMNEQQIQKYKE